VIIARSLSAGYPVVNPPFQVKTLQAEPLPS
jgi:hypothetical protein